MVIVWQAAHRAYILAKIDGAVSKLCFATFCVILYHAHQKIDINQPLNLFVFPNADEEMKDEEDEMEMDEDIQDKARPGEEVPSAADEDNS
jgi:hypothetical protein